MASNNVFWIQCNACPAEGQLSLTECGHLYCLNCIHKLKSKNNKCPICKKPTNYHPLNDLPENVRECFRPPNIFDTISSNFSAGIKKLEKLKRIDDFQKRQIQMFVTNTGRKEHMLKKQLQSALNEIQTLMKELAVKNECIKEYQAQLDHFNINVNPLRQHEKCTPSSHTGSKMSTPNSNNFMSGILKKQSSSTPMLTSTPVEHNPSPLQPRAAPSTHRLGTPTHFITPKSMNGSAEQRQQRMMMMNAKQQQQQQQNTLLSRQPTPSSLKQDSFVFGQQKVGNDSRFTTPSYNHGQKLVTDSAGRLRQSQKNVYGSVGRDMHSMEPPSKMKRPENGATPNPALMSYRDLVQGRNDSILYPDRLISGSSSKRPSTSPAQMRTTYFPGSTYNMTSHSSRSR